MQFEGTGHLYSSLFQHCQLCVIKKKILMQKNTCDIYFNNYRLFFRFTTKEQHRFVLAMSILTS